MPKNKVLNSEVYMILSCAPLKFIKVTYNSEPNAEGRYSIDICYYNKTNINQRLCIYNQSKSDCSGFDGYKRIQNFSVNEINRYMLYLTIAVTYNTTEMIDLTKFNKTLILEGHNNTNIHVNLNVSGLRKINFSNINVHLYGTKSLNVNTISLNHSKILSTETSLNSTLIMFDYYSQFWGVPFYHSDNFHLIDCSPKEIKFSDDSIYVDEYKFYKNYTVLIDNNLPWRTNIVLSEQAPGNLKLVNKNPNSVITIESLNSNLTNSLVIEPGCPIAFSNVVGEIPIKFKITSPSQFIIPEKFNVKFKSIEILNELDILTGNEIEVDDLKVSNTEIVPSGSISTQSVLFDSQNYNEVGCFKANVVNTTEDSFFRADLMGTDDVHIYIPIKSTSIPYMQFTSNNQKGHIYFVIDDNDNYIPHNLTEEFKILVLNIENSSCKNWKIHVSQAIKYITARCDNDYPDMYIFIERVQPAKIWITIVIALCSVIVFIFLVFASLYIYAKLKRKMELNYLNRLYEEKSFEAINQSLLPEAEEY